MADQIHLFQWVVAFAVASGFTAAYLLRRPTSRWRHIAAGIANTLLWIPVAYLSNNVYVLSDAGNKVAFGSEALVGVGTFMVFVSLLALIVGLVLWVEEEAEAMSAALPQELQRGD
jgi:hypothetical protein